MAAALVEKHFTCVICRDELQEPRRLECGHVYCHKCLQQHIKENATVRYNRRGILKNADFSCPSCRTTIPIPRPREASIDEWANQFVYDFLLANILTELKEIALSEPSDSEKPEREFGDMLQRIGAMTFPASSAVTGQSLVPEQNVTGSHTQCDDKAMKELKTTVKGELVRVISHQTGESSLELYDLVVLFQGKNRIVVTPDFETNKIITFVLSGEMEVTKTNRHDLGSKPWRICKVSNDQVAVTVSGPDGVLMCSVGKDVTVVRLFNSKKQYDGISVLPEERFVLSTRDKVDIVKYDGTVLQELKISASNVNYPDNSYVSCTLNQNIVVTDCCGKTAFCANQEGKIIWEKRDMIPMGVACDSNGSIYLADKEAEVVYKYTNRGRRVCRVVEKSEIFFKPSGIAVDGTGYLYVICDSKNITVWKLSSVEEDNG